MTSSTEDSNKVAGGKVAGDKGAAVNAFPCNRYYVFFAIASFGAALDLATKEWVFAKLWPPSFDKQRYLWIWTDHFGFEVSLNEGAVFGIGQGMVVWFVVLSLFAAVGIFYWLFMLGEARSLWLTIALAGITAGIFGNLYDRLGMHGLLWPPNLRGHAEGERVYAVRDWILVQWDHELKWPNFNIADSFLVCGAIMLLLHAFLPGNRPDGPRTAPTS